MIGWPSCLSALGTLRILQNVGFNRAKDGRARTAQGIRVRLRLIIRFWKHRGGAFRPREESEADHRQIPDEDVLEAPAELRSADVSPLEFRGSFP